LVFRLQARLNIIKLSRNPEIDSKESIPPAYVAGPELEFLKSLWGLGTEEE
jgi:hypothetical protein